eukprot:CAMPEP_0117456874 /NCGR_PEP_ID=MMETSP0784-20121206/77_1 /TAXON_ID=39447 /ORGANISM="" /LENGTH=60 /DNA_ID=CAMNT_0005250249 /DNA_START=141 /DNA_END=323 /DNA_ORIENTATION=+
MMGVDPVLELYPMARKKRSPKCLGAKTFPKDVTDFDDVVTIVVADLEDVGRPHLVRSPKI